MDCMSTQTDFAAMIKNYQEGCSKWDPQSEPIYLVLWFGAAILRGRYPRYPTHRLVLPKWPKP